MAQTLVFNPITGNFDAESVVTVGTPSGTSNANGATIDPVVQALTLTPADGTNPGIVSNTTQTFVGQKTFSTGLTGTLTGSATSFTGSLAGDVSGTQGATVLASVNTSGAGTYGSATQVPVVVLDAKGRVTSVTNTTITSGAPNVSTATGTLATTHGGTGAAQTLNNNRFIVSSFSQIVEAPAIIANTALVTDTNGLPVSGGANSGEVGFLSGTTGNIQTQFNNKQFLAQTDKNYLTPIITSNGTNTGYGNFEIFGVSGWTLGTVGTLTNAVPTGTPTFGSGAAGTLSIATVSTGRLAGTLSAAYASSAATTVGNMLAAPAVFIDTEDQAKVLTWKFFYSVPVGASTANFSGTSSNSFGVAVYDVTNSSWLTSTANFAMTQSTGVGVASGTCQTNSSTTSIRLVLYNANATTGAVTLNLDDFSISPQMIPIGSVATDWVAYTPTFTGFGTVTAINIQSRRVGDTLEVEGAFTAGTPTAVQGQVTLGYNGANSSVTTSSTKITALTVVGTGNINSSSASDFSGRTVQASSGAAYFTFGVENSGGNGGTIANGNAVCGTGAVISFSGRFPIQGWSSNVQMSSDTDTRVVAASAYLNATTSYAHPIIFNTVSYDTTGSYSSSTGIYTVPVSGYYKIYGVATSSGTPSIIVYKNGASISAAGSVQVAGNSSAYTTSTLCVAGDQLSVGNGASTSWTGGAPATNNTSVTFERLSGPSVIAASESVNMRYFSSSTTISGSLATVMYSTKGFDTHAAYNPATGIYTAPVSGKYQVNVSIAMTGTFVLNSILDLQVQQTGSNTQISESKAFSGGAVTQMNTNLGDIFYLLAGDQLKVQASNSGTTPAIAATTTQNWISLSRVGN